MYSKLYNDGHEQVDVRSISCVASVVRWSSAGCGGGAADDRGAEI